LKTWTFYNIIFLYKIQGGYCHSSIIEGKRGEKMRKELDYFRIGDSFGGNQAWFRNPMMHLGGCGAAAACDACINIALRDDNKTHLYPYDIRRIDKEDYIKFSKQMYLFL
jgi:hypothetical protein